MELTQIFKLVESFGLPIAILFLIVYYFYKREQKRETDITNKDGIILKLSEEKVIILDKVLKEYQASDAKNSESLIKIDGALKELRTDIKTLSDKIN